LIVGKSGFAEKGHLVIGGSSYVQRFVDLLYIPVLFGLGAALAYTQDAIGLVGPEHEVLVVMKHGFLSAWGGGCDGAGVGKGEDHHGFAGDVQ
jgi:hypothetical protein